ncbi:MAG: NAD(P)-dependent oxidoreductase, partial [Ruminococcus sp.]|nr:NAD(P)-dependent oxidoreductase [Ruminococcus sp.]
IICSDIPHTHLRMASLIGEGFNQRIVNRFVDKALRMEPLTVDDSLQKFGFLDVRDAAEAIRCILTMDAANWKPVYNVGSDSGYTLIEIIQAVKEVFTQEHLSFPDILTVESDNTGSTELDTCLLKTDSGFQTMYSLKESILWILRWYQNHSA